MALRHSLSVFLVLFLILSFGAPVFSQGLPDASNEYYQKGQQAYNSGQYKEAQTEYTKALSVLYETPGEQGGPLEKQLQQGLQQASLSAGNTTAEKRVTTAKGAKTWHYIITQGDVLYITVWQEEGLNQEVTVRPDGMISFPLVGEDVPAEGFTLPQLRAEITERLKEYIKYPEVSVLLKKSSAQEILVLGQVNFPGIYAVGSGKTTILHTIALAGGFTPDAVLSSVIVIHGGTTNAKGIASGTRVDLNRLIMKADMSQNIFLSSQDIVYVPKKFISNVNYFITQIFSPFSSTAQNAINLRKSTW